MTDQEIVTVGLSQAADDMLEEMVELGNFAQKVDGYRFAVSLGLAHGARPGPLEKRKTYLNVGSLDPDRTLQILVEELAPDLLDELTPYRAIERLADWGIRDLHQQATDKGIDFVSLLAEADELSE
jgi:Arc/MetJ-type ribon-helix-helix transcriptional regulator